MLKDYYFNWLMGLIDHDKLEDLTIEHVLYDRPFHYSIDMDSNRGAAGLGLRRDFIEDVYDGDEDPSDFLDVTCSTLEVLISLAINADTDIIGGEKTPGEWFDEFISNLGLGDGMSRRAITAIIERWLDREFKYDGYGSPFPLNNPDEDQREVEIWGQMLAYLNENYI